MRQKLIESNIKLENCNICYWEGGLASNSAPILFLPGWAVSVATYLESLKALSERHYLIAPDLPGFCKSTSPKFLRSYDDYANCLGIKIKPFTETEKDCRNVFYSETKTAKLNSI